jgi:hypothetical protein
MRALEVIHNSRKLCVAGLDPYGHAGLWIIWKRIIPPDAEDIREDLILMVSGVDSSGQHLNWESRNLAAGDTIRATLLELDHVDSPVSSLDSPSGKPWISDPWLIDRPGWMFWRRPHFLGFDIAIDNKHLTTLGVAPLGVTTFMLDWSRYIPHPNGEKVYAPQEDFSLSAFTLDTSSTYSTEWWASEDLSIGQTVDVRIDYVTELGEPCTEALIEAGRGPQIK